MGEGRVEAAKAALREEVLRRLVALEQQERGLLAVRANRHLLSVPDVLAAGTVLAFDAFGDEIPTTAIISELLEAGVRVLLPYLTDDGMEAAVLAPGKLRRSGYGPREPERREPADPALVDVAIVPGIAFDRTGGRLGRGEGNFDRFLPRLRTDALRIGFGFSAQLVERVPSGPHDARVDLVVTDEGVLDCRSVQ